MMKPPSWMGLRPRVSTVATVTQYPGTAPARTMIRLPIAVLYRISLLIVSKAVRGDDSPQNSDTGRKKVGLTKWTWHVRSSSRWR